MRSSRTIDLTIIVPSRGRPLQLLELLAAIRATATSRVQVLVGLDDDDTSPYPTSYDRLGDVRIHRGPRQPLSGWTNYLALQAIRNGPMPRYLASLGDDHRPRTRGWDRKLMAAIESFGTPGFAYGNDLLQGASLPTAWVMSAEIVIHLGWMMLPTCDHMYVDNATLTLGKSINRIAYMPRVIIEHMHPAVGKSLMDDSYEATSSLTRYEADQQEFEHWRDNGGLNTAVAKLRPLTARRHMTLRRVGAWARKAALCLT